MQLSIPEKLENFIGGEMVLPSSGQYIEKSNPATGESLYQIPRSNEKDVDNAVSAAEDAFPSWAVISPEKRYLVLEKIALLIEENMDFLAHAETLDTGKPLSLSKRIDISRAISNFRFYATANMHFASESHSTLPDSINYTLRQPLGVVACISPWNLPLYLFSWKVAPALAAGNCVVAKPSEVTPLTAYFLGLICKEAGLPPGVLNIIHGTGEETGEKMVPHAKVKAVSFTGSTRAGKRIASIASSQLKKISLELGGKNPNIIFADCDWEKMMKTTIHSSFSNQGQICLCGSRILIQESIYDQFKNEFVERTKALKVGDPFTKVDLGAVVSKVHFEKIMQAIETAKKENGKILTGGKAVKPVGKNANGYFIEPTIIEGLGPECLTNKEEIFGPVVTLQSFKDEKEALQLANACDYGLSATVWTKDISVANRMAINLNCGIVWINCWLLRDLRTPFGGTQNSGLGREGGWEAMRFFTEPKNVCIEI